MPCLRCPSMPKWPAAALLISFREVLVRGLGVSGLVVGPDFEFGKEQGRAISTTLAGYGRDRQGFTVACFDMVTASGQDAEKISSTRIRAALKAANPQEAARLLGRWWAVEARVEHGDARGRTMGFPTANMHLGHCLAPAFGVYAVRVTIMDNDTPGERHDGVANFGVRPMYETKVPLMEAHLFDFDGDLYGKHLSVELIAYIRAEAKFPDLAALIAQIGQDAKAARAILAANPSPRPARWTRFLRRPFAGRYATPLLEAWPMSNPPENGQETRHLARLSRHPVPARHRLSHEGRPARGRAQMAGALGGDGSLRQASRSGAGPRIVRAA